MKRRILGAFVLLLVGAPLAFGMNQFTSSGAGDVPWATPGAIGSTTPNTIVGTSIDATTQLFANDSSGLGTTNATWDDNGTSRSSALVVDLPDVTNDVGPVVFRWSNTAARTASYYFNRACGSQALPATCAANSQIGSLRFNTWDGSTWVNGVSLVASVDGTVSAAHGPGRLDFNITDLGGTARITQSLQTRGNVVWTMPTVAAASLTASTEQISYNFNDSSTKTFPTGDFATQRGVVFQPPTYAASGASTITNAVTLAVMGAPTCNSNMTCTNTAALYVASGLSQFAGGVSTGPSGGTCNLNGGTPATCTITGVPASCVRPVCGYGSAPGVVTSLYCTISGTTVTAHDTNAETATVNLFCP